jgi:hypothetical protein
VKAIEENWQCVRVAIAELFHHLFVSHVRFTDTWNNESGSRRVTNNGLVIQGSTPSPKLIRAQHDSVESSGEQDFGRTHFNTICLQLRSFVPAGKNLFFGRPKPLNKSPGFEH